MHELGIVFHTIKTVERVGADNGLTEVASVTLELGEVSRVRVPERSTKTLISGVAPFSILDEYCKSQPGG